MLSPRPARAAGDEVDSGSAASDVDAEYHTAAAAQHSWTDQRPGSDDFDKYTGWRHVDSDVRDDDVRNDDVTVCDVRNDDVSAARMSFEQHGDDDVAEQINITRHDDDDDDDERQARSVHRRRTSSPAVDRRRGLDCSSLRHHQQTQLTASPRSPAASHVDTDDRQQTWTAAVTPSQTSGGYSLSAARHPASFNVAASELHPPTCSAAAPPPPLPPGPPLSHELVRHLREQQVRPTQSATFSALVAFLTFMMYFFLPLLSCCAARC